MDTKKNANNFSAKNIVIVVLFIIILGLGYFLYTYKKEIDNIPDLQASISEKTNSIIALESSLSSATARENSLKSSLESSLSSATAREGSLKIALDKVIKSKDGDISDLQASIRDLTANANNYKKLCYYLLINEFSKNKMLDENDMKNIKNNYGSTDLYFMRDKYIPLIKEFTKDMNVSYGKFELTEKVILDAIKNTEKK